MQTGGVIRQQGREQQHDFRPIQARIWEWQWAKHVMAFGEQGQQQDEHSPGWSVISFSSMVVWDLEFRPDSDQKNVTRGARVHAAQTQA